MGTDLGMGVSMRISMRKSIACVAAAAALCGAAPAAATVVLQVNGSGQLTGATGVNVGGTLYDVWFLDGTCSSVFGNCDAASMSFASYNEARVAGAALLAQVFGSGTFDDRPDLTNGCTGTNACLMNISFNGSGEARLIQVRNASPSFGSDQIDSGFYSLTDDTYGPTGSVAYQSTNFARFTLSPVAAAVPEPATWAMMLLGFAAIGARLRRKGRRKTAFA